MIAKENSDDDRCLAAEIGSLAITVDDVIQVHVIHPTGHVKRLRQQQPQSSKDLNENETTGYRVKETSPKSE